MSKPYYTTVDSNAVANYTTSSIRFLNKSINKNERENYSEYWREQITLYGQNVEYYVNSYTTLSADNFYGEQPTGKFAGPTNLTMIMELAENAVALTKFGLSSDDEITAMVHVSSFAISLSGATSDSKYVYTNDNGSSVALSAVEPHAGDVFVLEEYGRERPNNARSGKWFEITEKLDQDISQINSIMGHYIWLLKAKRLEYSYEPGLSGEFLSDQVYDGDRSGRLSGGTNTEQLEDTYGTPVDTESKDVFDYTQYGEVDDVYGDYY